MFDNAIDVLKFVKATRKIAQMKKGIVTCAFSFRSHKYCINFLKKIMYQYKKHFVYILLVSTHTHTHTHIHMYTVSTLLYSNLVSMYSASKSPYY